MMEESWARPALIVPYTARNRKSGGKRAVEQFGRHYHKPCHPAPELKGKDLPFVRTSAQLWQLTLRRATAESFHIDANQDAGTIVYIGWVDGRSCLKLNIRFSLLLVVGVMATAAHAQVPIPIRSITSS